MRFDLVMLSIGGVQHFIAESRSAVDVAGASTIVQRLAKRAADVVEDRLADAAAPAGLVLPAAAGAGNVTNRIVFLAPEDAGPGLARAAAEEIRRGWRGELVQTFRSDQPPATPGMPDIAWVSVTGPVTHGDYRRLWEAAQREMVGRRRARVFQPVEILQRTLCAQSSGLPAAAAPRHVPPHERHEALSAAGWAKRQAGRNRAGADRPPFPSTVSIASSVFRSRLLHRAAHVPEVAAELLEPVRRLVAALDRLNPPEDHGTLRSVPVPAGLEPLAGRLGAWVSAERWDCDVLVGEYGTTLDTETVRSARRAVTAITAIARTAGVRAPSPYFAVIVQDIDRLGRVVGGFGLDQQREVSRQLSALAGQQRALVEERHPRAELVYAGGDDLLALCPAADALAFARSIREQVRAAVGIGLLATAGPGGRPVTASTGVVFAHVSDPLQDAVRSAHEAVRKAKEARRSGGRSRDALAVVVLRRGGQRSWTVLPWCQLTPSGDRGATELLDLIRPGPESGVLSGALGSDLERDREMLSELGSADQALLRAELVRLVGRHGGTRAAGDALCTLGLSERGVEGGHFEPVPAALVARFLSQETR